MKTISNVSKLRSYIMVRFIKTIKHLLITGFIIVFSVSTIYAFGFVDSVKMDSYLIFDIVWGMEYNIC